MKIVYNLTQKYAEYRNQLEIYKEIMPLKIIEYFF